MENINASYWSKKNKSANKKLSYFLVCFFFIIIIFIFSYNYFQEKSQLSSLKIKYDESIILNKQFSQPIKPHPDSGLILFSDTSLNNIKLLGIIKKNEKCWAVFSNKNEIQKALKNDVLSKDNYIILSINDSSVTLKQKNRSNYISMSFL